MKSSMKNISFLFAFLFMSAMAQAQNKVPEGTKCQKGEVACTKGAKQSCSKRKSACSKRSKRSCGIKDLTEEQRAGMKKEHTQLMKATLPLKNKLAVLKAELRSLQTADKVSQSRINAKIDQISRTKASIQKLKSESKQNIRKSLTEDQRIFFDNSKKRGCDYVESNTCSSKKKACSGGTCMK